MQHLRLRRNLIEKRERGCFQHAAKGRKKVSSKNRSTSKNWQIAQQKKRSLSERL